jgi:hypothetical protein
MSSSTSHARSCRAAGLGLAARPGLLPDASRTLAGRPDSGLYRQVGQPPATVDVARPEIESFTVHAAWWADARAYPDPVKYPEEARSLWQTSVPRSGQAATVQGELLRAVEKLRDESQRNGNINWNDSHQALIAYLQDTLLGSALFDQAAALEIETDLDRLSRYEYPESSDAPYDRLADHVIGWCRAHPQPLPHTPNPDMQL